MLLLEAISLLVGTAIKYICGGSKKPELSQIMNRYIGTFCPYIYKYDQFFQPRLSWHHLQPIIIGQSQPVLNFRFCTQLLSGILKHRKKIPLHVNLSSRRQFHSFIQSCISIWMHFLQLCNAPEFTDSSKMKDLLHFQREYFRRDQIKTLFNITPGLLVQRCLHQSTAYSVHL